MLIINTIVLKPQKHLISYNNCFVDLKRQDRSRENTGSKTARGNSYGLKRFQLCSSCE